MTQYYDLKFFGPGSWYSDLYGGTIRVTGHISTAILNIKHVDDWKHIKQRKQLQIIHNNKRKNIRRNNHQYKVGEKILVKRKKNSQQGLYCMGPFHITQMNGNGTVRFQKVIINDATNIRIIKPFFGKT